MKRILSALAMSLLYSTCVMGQNYKFAWFDIEGLTNTNGTQITQTVGPFRGQLVSMEATSISGLTFSVTATNVTFAKTRAIISAEEKTAGIRTTNFASTIFLYDEYLLISAYSNIDVSGTSGHLKGCVAIQE